MPKRTNLFQQVVAAVYRQLSDGTVEESAMLHDEKAGTDREVDVLIRGQVAGEEISVAVEATAQDRKLDLPAVQRIIAKHQAIGTSQVIIVSESGFTEPARRTISGTPNVAGYQPTDLNNEKQLETKIVGRLSKLWPRRFSVTLSTVFAEIELPAALLGTNAVPWTGPPPLFPLLLADGTEVATADAIFSEWAENNTEEVGLLLDVGNTVADTDAKTFQKDLYRPWRADGREFPELYVNVDTNIDPNREPTPEPLKIRKLDLRGPASIRVSEMDLRHQQLNDNVVYTVGQTIIEGESLLLVASATSRGERMTTLVLGADSSRPTNKRRKSKTRRKTSNARKRK